MVTYKVDIDRLNIPYSSEYNVDAKVLEDGNVKINVWNAKKTNVELFVYNNTKRYQPFRSKLEIEETPCGTFELIPHINERKLLFTLAITRTSERCFQVIEITEYHAGVSSFKNYKEVNEFIEDFFNSY